MQRIVSIAQTDNLENRRAVLRGRGVVVIAKQQNVIDGRADLSAEASTSPRRISRRDIRRRRSSARCGRPA